VGYTDQAEGGEGREDLLLRPHDKYEIIAATVKVIKATNNLSFEKLNSDGHGQYIHQLENYCLGTSYIVYRNFVRSFETIKQNWLFPVTPAYDKTLYNTKSYSDSLLRLNLQFNSLSL